MRAGPPRGSRPRSSARVAGVHVDLEAVLAGVAGARDDARARRGPCPSRSSSTRSARGRPSVSGWRISRRERALERDLRPLGRLVLDRRRPAAPRGLRPCDVLRRVRGVHDEEVVVGGEPVGQEVVDEGARARSGRPSTGPARRTSAATSLHVRRWTTSKAPSALDADLAHVRDVEEAGPLADGDVLLREARVLDGHLPAAERDDLAAESLVSVEERRALEGGRFGRGAHRRRPGTIGPALTARVNR